MFSIMLNMQQLFQTCMTSFFPWAKYLQLFFLYKYQCHVTRDSPYDLYGTFQACPSHTLLKFLSVFHTKPRYHSQKIFSSYLTLRHKKQWYLTQILSNTSGWRTFIGRQTWILSCGGGDNGLDFFIIWKNWVSISLKFWKSWFGIP